MCEVKNKVSSWLKLNWRNLGKYHTALLVANGSGSFLCLYFLFYESCRLDSNKDWYWDNVFTVLWTLLAMLVTALTFVLSIYLPPILKELKNLSIGVNKSIRYKLIKNNPISLNIFQMILSIIILAFLTLELFFLSLMTFANTQELVFISIVVMIYAVVTLCLWVLSIYELALIDANNYVYDCLLLLPTDSKNQRSYYTIIQRQLHNHLTKNDVYRFNDDLIQIAKFIANKKSLNFMYFEDFCIKPLFYAHDESQYIKNIIYTYDTSIQRYSYSEKTTTSDDLGLPEESITTFQEFLFSSDSAMLPHFLYDIVETNSNLQETSQSELVDYYLWVLDNLCITNDEYGFTFAFDITRSFKQAQDARKFLLDAMKIALNRENKGAASGLFRGYLLFLAEHGVINYIELNDQDGNKAWLFSDLIHLSMINLVLNGLEELVYDEWFFGGQFIYDITKKCIDNKDMFLEWIAFIYCYNKIAQFEIKEEHFKKRYSKDSIFDNINTEYVELLRQVLDGKSQLIVIDYLKFTRAIQNRDFWKNTKILETNYYCILDDIISGK